MDSKAKDKYIVSWNYRQLLQKYDLDDYGLWHVKGEDPNCDLHGPHYQPSLGYFEGRLGDIIDMAVEMERFWQWGAGGDFELIKISKPDEVWERTKLEKQKRDLLEQIADIDRQLSEL